MKHIDWTKWSSIAEIISSIAILITLVYLAVQTQQTNALLESEAQEVLRENRVEYQRLILENSELRDLLVKIGYRNPGAAVMGISNQETLQIIAITDIVMTNWSQEFAIGKLNNVEIPVNGYRTIVSAYPFIWGIWENGLKNNFPADFRQFMDEQVFSTVELGEFRLPVSPGNGEYSDSPD